MTLDAHGLHRGLERDEQVLAVMLFGGYLRDVNHSDIDVCIILRQGDFNGFSMSRKRLEFLEEFPAHDVQIFQQLPMYVRIRVLEERRVVSCRDEESLYDIATNEVREFEGFKPIYDAYLEEVLHA